MDISDKSKFVEKISTIAKLHTDIVIVRSPDEQGWGLASVVYVRCDNGKTVAVTCKHVVQSNCTYYVGIDRLPSLNDVSEDLDLKKPIKPVYLNDSKDIAVFEMDGKNSIGIGKSAYELEKSKPVTFERLAKHLKMASLIYGLPANFTKLESHPYSKLGFMLEMPMYCAGGPILTVSKSEIIGDFTEKELISLNSKADIKTNDKKLAVGKRDLRGMSGSGLWTITDNEDVILMGILRGAAESEEEQHLIRFTPIWDLMEIIQLEVGKQ